MPKNGSGQKCTSGDVVVELPQTPEDDLQKRYNWAWKADELIS